MTSGTTVGAEVPPRAGAGSQIQAPRPTSGPGSSRDPTHSASERAFVSYIGVHCDQDASDADGLDLNARMELESQAIKAILSREPELQRTPPGNPGFDLFEAGDHGSPVRWVEVKAMTGGLKDRPVGLSRTQFEYAQRHREAYWLYAVEHAADAENVRIVRIQDPAGRAQTFTFDRGWLEVAQVDSPSE